MAQQTVDQNAEPDGIADLTQIPDHVIGRRDIDRSYDELRAAVDDPSHGLFGPDSMLWRMLEPLPVLPFMLIQAGLLEGPQPKIFWGTEHSVTRTGDFGSRYARSYDAFFDWFCGDVDSALRTARRIHGYHGRIGGHAPEALGHVEAGQPYRATEQDLMLWTMGTQIVPIKQFYEQLVKPLTPAETEQFWDECKTFAKVFGVDAAAIPPTWSDFEKYWDDSLSSGELALSGNGLDRFGPLADPSTLPMKTRWLVKWIMTVQFNLLPESVRLCYEPYIPMAKKRPAFTAATCLGFKGLMRVLPRGVRSSPRVVAARQRAGRAGPPNRAERWMATKLRHPFGEAQPTLNTPASPEADPKHSQAFTQPPAP